MTWNNSSFTEHYRKIKIEGFQPDKLVDRCIRDRIRLRGITFVSNLELTLFVSDRDFKKLKKMAGNRYKITILGNGGCRYWLGFLRNRKITILGMILFAAFLYYQSLFVVEIRIDGYEKISEASLRETLAEAGLYEGCRKKLDVDSIKIRIYEEYDNISWAGITLDGNLAQVKISEGANPIKKEETKVAKKKPCNIVADKAGYISSVDPEEGLRAVKDGAYVKKGDVLITGKIPLNSTAYGTDSEDKTETYVHAAGTVEAKIPQRLHFFAEAYERIKKETGRCIWGISINGHNPAKALNTYETCIVETKNLFNIVKPFRLKVDLVCVKEVRISQRKAGNRELKKAVNAQVRRYVKENLPESTQILNKSLNFSREKNIITIGVTLETLQKIGIEEEIVVDKQRDGQHKKNRDR